LTEAVTTALRERLERVQASRRSAYEARLKRLVDEYNSYEVVDDRSADEILGYDGNGLPS
jgi:antitoxin VapB